MKTAADPYHSGADAATQPPQETTTNASGVKRMGTKRSSTLRDKHRAIIARTRPNCHICGEVIIYELKWPNKWCYVVDHIVPLHKGGTDTLDNKAAAHNACNSSKRARDHAPIIRRSKSLDW